MTIEAFFNYARKRHQIYLDRLAGKPGPWTDDPILRQYRFTNVFRELDKVTLWYAKHVRDCTPPEAVLLATVIFRWYNRIESGEAIFTQKELLNGGTAWEHYGLDWSAFKLALRSALKTYCGDGPYVTGSYIINTPPGMTKFDGVLWNIEQFIKGEAMWYHTDTHTGETEGQSIDWRVATAAMLRWPGGVTLEGMWKWLRQFPSMGDFMAYEVVTDLRHTPLLNKAPDIMTWANPGPGAARGAGRVFKADHKAYTKQQKSVLNGLMHNLLVASRDPKHWPQPLAGGRGATSYSALAGDHNFKDAWPAWEMREVEHTLCEFDKYERVRLGEGRPRQVFRSA